MAQNDRKAEVSIEALEAELVALIEDPAIREEWLNTPIPILESRMPKSFYYTEQDRARLMQALLEMKFGEMA